MTVKSAQTLPSSQRKAMCLQNSYSILSLASEENPVTLINSTKKKISFLQNTPINIYIKIHKYSHFHLVRYNRRKLHFYIYLCRKVWFTCISQPQSGFIFTYWETMLWGLYCQLCITMCHWGEFQALRVIAHRQQTPQEGHAFPSPHHTCRSPGCDVHFLAPQHKMGTRVNSIAEFDCAVTSVLLGRRKTLCALNCLPEETRFSTLLLRNKISQQGSNTNWILTLATHSPVGSVK